MKSLKVKERIRSLVAKDSSEGEANACQIWKGYGELGQAPHGWYVKKFNKSANWIGSSWKEIMEIRQSDGGAG